LTIERRESDIAPIRDWASAAAGVGELAAAALVAVLCVMIAASSSGSAVYRREALRGAGPFRRSGTLG